MMTSLSLSAVRRWDWRRIVFTILAGLGALLFLMNLYRLTAPWAPLAWYPNDDPRQLNPDLHRWHDAMWGAVAGILEGGALLVLLLRPREKPLLMQYQALNIIVAAPLILPFEPQLVFVMIILLIIIASYPAPRALLDFSQKEPISRPLLALSLTAAVLLAPYMLRLLIWQIQGAGGEQATANEWIADVEHSALLLAGAFMACTKRPGWRALGILTGLVFLYLGVAALALPTHAGSWGVAGGIVSLLGGLLYIAATIREARRPLPRMNDTPASVV
jgi:hypothetical protein